MLKQGPWRAASRADARLLLSSPAATAELLQLPVCHPHPEELWCSPRGQLSKYSHLQSTVTCIDKAKVLGFPQDQQGTLFMTLERRPDCSQRTSGAAGAMAGTWPCPSGTRLPRHMETVPKPNLLQQSTTLAGPEKTGCCPLRLLRSISFAWTDWAPASCSHHAPGSTASSESPRKTQTGLCHNLSGSKPHQEHWCRSRQASRARPGPSPLRWQARSRWTTPLTKVARLKVVATVIPAGSGHLPTLLQAR